METKKHNFGGKNKGMVCHQSHTKYENCESAIKVNGNQKTQLCGKNKGMVCHQSHTKLK